MKKLNYLLTAIVFSTSLYTASAQFGGGSAGPSFSAATAKLFGEHQTFSATMEFEMAMGADGKTMTMPGKLSYDHGKSRFEMNLGEIKGLAIPPQAASQMKAMGMDEMTCLTFPDKKTTVIIYPGMQSYVEIPLPKSEVAADDFKVEITELGKEAADGHACVKNKVVLTEPNGKKHESTVWNATDLKQFPVKITTTEQGHQAVMHFNNISFSTPAASAFTVPSSLKKYDSMQAMMQEVMMKKMGGMMPPH